MKASERIKILLNPDRLRIIRVMASGDATVLQISEALPGIPQATLYRHVRLLKRAGILKSVKTTRKRGTVETLYTISYENIVFRQEDLKDSTKDELLEYFSMFASSLIVDFSDYLSKTDKPDFQRDAVKFYQHPLALSADDAHEFFTKQMELIDKYSQNRGDNEEGVILTTIMIPEFKGE